MEATPDEEEANLSFAGCGFLGIYHVGVASCIKQYAPHLYRGKISGASAGALTACGLITDICLGEATSWTLAVATKARAKTLGPFNPSFDIVKLVRDGFMQTLPDNAHIIASGRLHISLTEIPSRNNVIVSQFDSKEDLVQALICSSFVPLWSGVIPPLYKGKRYIDGGISDNIPILNKNTITVSPFAGESDICPKDNSENLMNIHLANTSIQFTMGNVYRFTHALMPPEPDVLSSMCQQGFSDALKYLQRHTLANCSKHLSIHSSIEGVIPRPSDEYKASSERKRTKKHKQKVLEKKDETDAAEEEYADLKNMPLADSLSPAVLMALQAACDSVNKGIMGPLYNARAYKVLALLAAPCTVPLDLAFTMTKRFLDWAPYMPADLRWFVLEFCELIKYLVHYIQHRRKSYSARFSCQLAISEVDYNQAALEHASKQIQQQQIGPHTRRNLNVGFSLDFSSHHNSPLRCVDEMRHHLLEEEQTGTHNVDMHQLLPASASCVGLDLQADRDTIQSSETVDVDTTTYDTFENCLQVADDMDSVLAYYYTDEQNPGVIRVTEIFGMDEAGKNEEQNDYISFKASPSTSKLDTILE